MFQKKEILEEKKSNSEHSNWQIERNECTAIPNRTEQTRTGSKQGEMMKGPALVLLVLHLLVLHNSVIK